MNQINIKDGIDDIPIYAQEFYSASRKVPVSSIIEFIKMLIEYTISKNRELNQSVEADITYQLINKKVDA
tara:strand:- start:264 stop:473 length:210 start_codon:yes stop_codon:yes gene_type:complete